MKALIPTAGQGTRLYPQTHTKPKAMVRLAGRPILGHILGGLVETAIDDVVLVVGGPMQEQIMKYARNTFEDRFDFEFVEQESAEGLGHSIYQAESVVGDEPLFIALGDMLFECGYEMFLESHYEYESIDGSIGVKRVPEPQHYGVVDVDDDKRVVRLVEKPSEPPSNYAISGVYVVENTWKMFEELEYLIANDIRGAGDEYQLTDAFERMVERDADLRIFEVEAWYDCGRPETLLEANRVLLKNDESQTVIPIENSVIVPPVDTGIGVTIERSVVGPYTSIDDGATIADSIVRDSIIGNDATIMETNLTRSIIGSNASVTGESAKLNVGDNSTIKL